MPQRALPHKSGPKSPDLSCQWGTRGRSHLANFECRRKCKKTFSGELSCPETFPGTEPPRTWRLLGHTAPWGIHSKPPGQTHPPLWAVLADNTDSSESSRVNEKSGTGRAQLRCSSSHGTPSTRPAPMTFLFLPGTRRGRNSSDHLVTSLWKHCVPLIGSMSTAMHTSDGLHCAFPRKKPNPLIKILFSANLANRTTSHWID